MKKLNLIATFIISGSMMISCGGGEDSEESSESTETLETTEETSEENETSEQIVMDLDNATFKEYLASKEGVLIDLRTPGEVADGSIDGSVNIDFNAGDFETAIDTLDSNTPTFVYCQSGGRSGRARDMLKDNGFLEVYNLADGYGNWEE